MRGSPEERLNLWKVSAIHVFGVTGCKECVKLRASIVADSGIAVGLRRASQSGAAAARALFSNVARPFAGTRRGWRPSSKRRRFTATAR